MSSEIILLIVGESRGREVPFVERVVRHLASSDIRVAGRERLLSGRLEDIYRAIERYGARAVLFTSGAELPSLRGYDQNDDISDLVARGRPQIRVYKVHHGIGLMIYDPLELGGMFVSVTAEP